MVDEYELSQLHTNQRLFIMEMQSRGINVDVIYKEMELIRAEYGKHIEWILDRDSSITPYSVSIICGDKYVTKKILEQSEISVPTGENLKVFRLLANPFHVIPSLKKTSCAPKK